MNSTDFILRWNRIHGLGMALMAFSLIAFNNVTLLVLWSLVSFGYYIVKHHSLLRSYNPYGGVANIITFIRLLLLILLSFFRRYPSNLTIISILIFILILDGFDGYFARKYKTSSEFGAHFDMETDAFFIALLTSILYSRGLVPVWILIPGFLRYFYVLLLSIIGWDHIQEPKSNHARIIAILVFSALFTPQVLSKTVYLPITAFASILLIISFGISFVLFYKHVKQSSI